MMKWPSIQRDSEILRRRIAAAQRVHMTRERLIYLFADTERRRVA